MAAGRPMYCEKSIVLSNCVSISEASLRANYIMEHRQLIVTVLNIISLCCILILYNAYSLHELLHGHVFILFIYLFIYLYNIFIAHYS